MLDPPRGALLGARRVSSRPQTHKKEAAPGGRAITVVQRRSKRNGLLLLLRMDAMRLPSRPRYHYAQRQMQRCRALHPGIFGRVGPSGKCSATGALGKAESRNFPRI